MLWKNYGKAMEFLFWGSVRTLFTVSTMSHMLSKKHSNAAGQSSRGSSSKGRMQLTSYLWKKIGMLWKNYGKAMEFLFWGSVRTLFTVSTMSHMLSKKHSNAAGQSSRGSSSKGRMQLTSYLWKNYGKAMEFLFWGSVRTL